jgi:hypothetical protein
MVTEHECFETPADDAVIWRFMNSTKFLSMIVKQTLFFCRADKLEDPYEGQVPKRSIEVKREYLKSMSVSPSMIETFANLDAASRELARTAVFLNCWHVNNDESAAMWKLYASNDEGIAIRSTVKRLRDSLARYSMPIYMGTVDYIDFARDVIQHGNVFLPFLHKRHSFEHENELRVVGWLPNMFSHIPMIKGENLNQRVERLRPLFDGHIPVDLEVLIEKAYVAPTAPAWYTDLIQSVVDKYGLNKKVERSSLYTLT